MTINNFNLFKTFLNFQEGFFYEVVILQRKKDNPSIINNQSARIIKSYVVENLNYLINKEEEMIKLAEVFNARVYIKPFLYSKEKLGFKILELLSQKFQNKDLDYSNLVVKATGNMSPENRLWVIDIDYDIATEREILYIQTAINDCDPSGDHIMLKVPTPNGVHLITKPFNTQQFLTKQDVYYKCEVKKNNPTILYSNTKQL